MTKLVDQILRSGLSETESWTMAKSLRVAEEQETR